MLDAPLLDDNNIIIKELSPTFACIRNGKKRILLHSQNAEYPHGGPNTLEVPLNTLAGDLNTPARLLTTLAGFADYPAHFLPSSPTPPCIRSGKKHILLHSQNAEYPHGDPNTFEVPPNTLFVAKKALQSRDEYLGEA